MPHPKQTNKQTKSNNTNTNNSKEFKKKKKKKEWPNIKKSQNIITMIAKSSFAFYAIINCSNCVKELHLGWTLLSLSKKHPRPNLKTFQYQTWTSMKRTKK